MNASLLLQNILKGIVYTVVWFSLYMALVINSFKLNISNVFVSYKIYYKMMVAYFALILGKDFHDFCLGESFPSSS